MKVAPATVTTAMALASSIALNVNYPDICSSMNVWMIVLSTDISPLLLLVSLFVSIATPIALNAWPQTTTAVLNANILYYYLISNV